MKTLKVQAKERSLDISRAGVMPHKQGQPISWSQGFSRAGIRFPVSGFIEVSIVDGEKAYAQDFEVTKAGAKAILSSPQLKVADCEYARELLKEIHAGLDRYDKFNGAEITDDSFQPLADKSDIPGHDVVWQDEYEAMTKPMLKEALMNQGFEKGAVNELWQAGKDAMISALRGH